LSEFGEAMPSGEPYLLWRAVDQRGAELDILLQKRRDKAAAKRFFKRVRAACPEAPSKIVTDQLRSYPAAKAEIPELANVKHVFVKASARVNNRAENSHQPTRERERRIPQGDFLRGVRGFRDTELTQAFLSSYGPIRQHFTLKRHLLRASLYRKQLGERFATCIVSPSLAKIRPVFEAKAVYRTTAPQRVNVTTPKHDMRSDAGARCRLSSLSSRAVRSASHPPTS
jgi:hypothetical protein